jgi:hypothetical protein
VSNDLQGFRTEDLIRELENRHVFSRMFAAISHMTVERSIQDQPAFLLAGVAAPDMKLPDPGEPAITLPKGPFVPPTDVPAFGVAVSCELEDPRTARLFALGAALDATKDDRRAPDQYGLQEGDEPRYIVKGEDAALLRETSLEELDRLIASDELGEAEKEEARRLASQRRRSGMSFGTAQDVIAANLKNGAQAAFIQPRLPPDLSKAVTQEDIWRSRGWRPGPFVYATVDVWHKDAENAKLLVGAIRQDPVLGGYCPDAFAQAASTSAKVVTNDSLVLMRLFRVFRELLIEHGTNRFERLFANIMEVQKLDDGNMPGDVKMDKVSLTKAFHDLQRFVTADLNKEMTRLENRADRGSAMETGRLRWKIRLVNPGMVEREVPDSFYSDGPGSDTSVGLKTPGLRSSMDEFFHQEGIEQQGTFTPAHRRTGNRAVDVTLANYREGEEE